MRNHLHKLATAIFWMIYLFTLLNNGATGVESRVIVTLATYILFIATLLLFGLPRVGTDKVFYAAVLLVTCLIVQTHFQAMPITGSARANSAWPLATMFAKTAPVPTVSLTPADDRLGLLSAFLPFGAFMTGLLLFETDQRATRALRCFGLLGGGIALYSILQFLFFPDMLVFSEKRYYLGSLTGFFVNRNTAATFFGLVLLTLVALLWKAAQAIDWGQIRAFIQHHLMLPPDMKRQLRMIALLGSLAALCFIALMLTGSRAGVMSSFAALVLLIVLSGFNAPPRRRSKPAPSRRRSGRKSRIRTILLIAIAIGIFSLFANRVALRMGASLEDDLRFCYMPGIEAAITGSWPWGSGLASFTQSYAPHHLAKCGVNAVVTHAHNVYAEGLLTLGIAFPFYAAFFILVQLFIFVRGIRKRKHYRFAAHLGLSGLLLVVLHSTLDFSLQIPGFAMAYAIFLAPVVTICLRPPGKKQKKPRKDGTQYQQPFAEIDNPADMTGGAATSGT